MKRRALLPEHFESGEPLNGRAWNGAPYCVGIPRPCRDETFDYAAAHWARGWHHNVGARDSKQMGGYHQNPDTLRSDADRLRVEAATLRNGETAQVVRLLAGMRGRHGGAVMTHPFAPVRWAERKPIKWIQEFRARSEVDTFRFANMELRGAKDFQPRNETVEALTFVVSERELKFQFWHERLESAPISRRAAVMLSHALALDTWYRLAVTLAPVADAPNAWRWNARVWQSQRVIWHLPPAAERTVAGQMEMNMVMFGNEHSLYRNQSGGLWQFAPPRVWLLEAHA